MKNFKKLICFLICYLLVLTSLPLQVIAASTSSDTVINNGSLLVKEGEWLYYRNSSDGGSIYKIKTDGTENTKINDISSCNINIDGDWIYFKSLNNLGNSYSESKFYELYRIKKDGTGLQDFNSKSISDKEKIIDGYIYYLNYNNGNPGIYKMKSDGTENTRIIDCISCEFGKDFVVYSSYETTTTSPYKTRKTFISKYDGSDKIQLDSYPGKITDNYVYMRNSTSIYRMNADGSEKTDIYPTNSYNIRVLNDDWLYDDTEKAFKRIDGSKVINESDITYASWMNPNIVGDWFYYHKNDSSFYALKTDGSQKLKIYSSAAITSNGMYSYDNHLFSCINDENYIYYINDYGDGEKFLYKFDINSGTSEKLTPEEEISKVSNDKKWTVKFTKEFDQSTVNANNILVTDGDNLPVKVAITPNADGKSITISKVATETQTWNKIRANATEFWDKQRMIGAGGKQIYNIKITKDVKDKDGQNLKRYVIKKFEIN